MSKKSKSGKHHQVKLGSPQWREFEQFVARIEQALAPKGAVVTFSDRIPDSVTKQPRQVDVSIRYQDSNGPQLIAVECRKRERISDVTWIEQLVTRGRDIGATRTIVVTSKHLSKPARTKALHYGIETRIVDHVTDAEIASWIGGMDLQAIEHHLSIDSLRLDLAHSASVGDLNNLQLFQKVDNRPIKPSDLLRALIDSESMPVDGQTGISVWDGIEPGKGKRCTTDYVTREPFFYLIAEGSKIDVFGFHFGYSVWKTELRPISFTVGAVYSSPDQQLLRVAEGTVPLNDDETLIVQWCPGQQPT